MYQQYKLRTWFKCQEHYTWHFEVVTTENMVHVWYKKHFSGQGEEGDGHYQQMRPKTNHKQFHNYLEVKEHNHKW